MLGVGRAARCRGGDSPFGRAGMASWTSGGPTRRGMALALFQGNTSADLGEASHAAQERRASRVHDRRHGRRNRLHRGHLAPLEREAAARQLDDGPRRGEPRRQSGSARVPAARDRLAPVLRSYFYWTTPEVWPIGVPGPLPVPSREEQQLAAREMGGPDLHSARTVAGYDLAARDGDIGHVEDFLLDFEAWVIRYIIVDARNWLPGKQCDPNAPVEPRTRVVSSVTTSARRTGPIARLCGRLVSEGRGWPKNRGCDGDAPDRVATTRQHDGDRPHRRRGSSSTTVIATA